jgi:uncharacterized membrane protein YsdA (DUF1294 family)
MIEFSAYIPLAALTRYLIALNAIGFGAMVWDKLAAKAGMERLSERSLAVVTALGGFLGVIAGGLIVHHKTSKPGFWAPVAFATFLWVVFLIAYFNPWVLPF